MKTIQGLGLRRDELEDERAEFLEPLEALCSVIEDVSSEVQSCKVESARSLLKKAKRPEAKFSAMMRDFLNSHDVGVEAG